MTKRANGDGDVYPRKNKDGQITSYRGAYFGADGRRHYVSGKTKTEARNALATARTNAAGGIPPSPANLTAEKYLSMWLTDSIEGRFTVPRTMLPSAIFTFTSSLYSDAAS
jgi:hypothetical protein